MQVPILAAPTASGKTALALELALSFGLEIVSADAMLVYRGMDIGTAKPTSQEQSRVPHHLIDVAKPDEHFSVARYIELAEKAIYDILDRGKLPFIVGGTGFYIRALTEGLPTVPEADFGVQQPLWDRFEREGIDKLSAELAHFSLADAQRAQRNPRRVIRALEIISRTGKAPSSFPNTSPAFCYTTCVLLPPVGSLEQRIQQRTELMLEAGWLDEVRTLLSQYPDLATAKQALGYDTLAAHLAGTLSLAEAKAQITLHTLKYAKRQRTWFRKEKADLRLEALAQDARAEIYDWLAQLMKGK